MDPDEHEFTYADTSNNGYWKIPHHQPTQESLWQTKSLLVLGT